MIGFTTTHQEICVTICIWALFVIVFTVAALWKPRISPSPDADRTSANAEPGLGLRDPPNPYALELKTPRPSQELHIPRVRQALFLADSDGDGGDTTLLTAHTPRQVDPAVYRDLESGKLGSMGGTVQRIEYVTRALRVVASGQVWRFTLGSDSRLWFDDKRAVLRCFHPLDHVLIIYAADGPPHVIKAMYAWVKQSA